MDDFILGVLSVLTISLLSDILNCILLRTKSTDRRFTITGLVSAFLLNELSHLRSLHRRLSNTFTRAPPHSAAAAALSHSALVRQARIFSLFVVLLAIFLFSADVLVVVFTQPSVVLSRQDQYTIESIIPVSVDESLRVKVYQALQTRPCVTPVIMDGIQRRRYNIVYCALITNATDETLSQSDKILNTSVVRIESWVHEAGADHNVIFAGGFINIRARAQILMAKEEGGARRLVFAVDNDRSSNSAILYLHRLTIYNAKRTFCSQLHDATPNWCHDNSNIHTKPFLVQPRVSELTFWTKDRSGNLTIVNATGVASSFALPFPASPDIMFSALHPLVVNAVLTERRSVDHSTLVRVVNNSDYQDGAPGLLEEDKRDIGVALLTLMCFIFGTVSILLHFKLRPVSLGLIAVSDVVHVDKNGVRLANSSCLSDPTLSFDGILPSCDSAEIDAGLAPQPRQNISTSGQHWSSWRWLPKLGERIVPQQLEAGAGPQTCNQTPSGDDVDPWERDWQAD